MNMVGIEIAIMTVIVARNCNVNSGLVTATHRAKDFHRVD